MNTSLKTAGRIATTIALVTLLGACAYAPGMRFERDAQSQPGDATSVPQVTPITPSYVLEQKAIREQAADDTVRTLFGTPEPYRIGPGDILSVVVWDHPELVLPSATYAILGGTTGISIGDSAAGIPGYLVSADGYVQFPYIGMVRVAGMTEVEARDLLLRGARDHIENPQITLRILGFRSKRIYVEGEVKTPGSVAINDVPMTLMEALNRTGGVLPSADRSQINVTRGGQTIRVSLPDLLRRGLNPSSIALQSGDIVRVVPREESKVFVLGEVTRPTTLVLRDGRLSLNEALGEAGGPNQATADSSQIFVVRSNAQARPEVYHLDARSASALAVAENFELKPKDVIFVDAGDLVRWNRFITLLFPSAQTVQTIRTIN